MEQLQPSIKTLSNGENSCQKSRILAELDAAYGRTLHVSWMANSTTELNFLPNPYIEEPFSKKININFNCYKIPETLKTSLNSFYNNQHYSQLSIFE